MSDNPMDSLPSFNRLSIRAVLVTDGQDPRAALADAGIFNPVAIPVVLGEDFQSGDLLGNAITPNLTGVLEPDQEDDWGFSPPLPANRTSAAPTPQQPEKSAVTTLPEAFGRRAFAPVAGRSRI
jgi:hypothetical protein